MSWYGSETPVFDESFLDAESIDKVEKETAKLLANIKGDRPWMNALKRKSKELKASKPSKSSQPGITDEAENADGKTKPAAKKNTKPAEAENTKPAEAENTKPDEASQPQGTDVPSADAAASSAEARPPSPAATEAAQPQPLPPNEKEPDPRYVPTCAVGDIVIVKASRKQFHGHKAKVLMVSTENCWELNDMVSMRCTHDVLLELSSAALPSVDQVLDCSGPSIAAETCQKTLSVMKSQVDLSPRT